MNCLPARRHLPFARLRAAVVAVALAVSAAAGCTRREPPKSYALEGQVLAVDPDRQEITVKHADILGLMPGMAMSFPVATADLLKGRESGELIRATLEVGDALGRLTAIEHVGFSALPTDSNAAAMAGAVLEVGDDAPDAAFIDQQHRRRAFSNWRGSITLVTCMYTRCPLPHFCPLMDKHFAALQSAIVLDPALRDRLKLVSVSFDSEFDTPEALAAHATRLKADPEIWTFLTGDRVTVDRFAAKLGVGLVRPADRPEITHNLRTVLIGADGRIGRIYSGNEWTPATALADIRSALRAP